ncbi:hypothetical protein LQ327_33350 [Actinomycetospora endophytica]|uniref:Secreted protein with PEP-CTERM sorting signal n=1 Tax=Actinomycetospora endophytica TaxID=2291215 RepID=A0ABS8PJ14_9PSEU|nr:hypothetical protein [Actinomycetospora endophytica]MCD2198263.1 hypothetical protein [Actinomycetospora endophytica]
MRWWQTRRGLGVFVAVGAAIGVALAAAVVSFLAARAGRVPSTGPSSAVATYTLAMLGLMVAAAVWASVGVVVLVRRRGERAASRLHR